MSLSHCLISIFALSPVTEDYALGHPAKVGFRNLGLGFRVFLWLGLALGLVLYLGLVFSAWKPIFWR